MPNYEVYIPAKPNSDQKNMTVVVEAPTWLLALRSGMQKIGDQGDSLSSILCENQPDGSIIIKDPVSRRIFTIRETDGADSPDAQQLQQEAEQEAQNAREEAERLALEEEDLRRQLEEQKRAQEERERKEREEAERRAKEEAERLAREEEERKAREAEEAELRAMEETERQLKEEAQRRADEAARQKEKEEARRKAEDEERQRLEEELKAREQAREEASQKAADLADGKAREVATTYDEKPESVSISQQEEEEVPFDPNEVLADLFERTMDLYTMNYEESFELIMNLAMDVIQAESGAIILSDYESALRELYFIETRGPVADQIKTMRIPRGKGIVGFSVNTGVSVAINDVNKNPNWYQEIAKKSDYPTRSLLCVPINIEDRTFGAIELINKKGSDRWSNGEINVVNFLADKAAEVLATKAASVNIENI